VLDFVTWLQAPAVQSFTKSTGLYMRSGSGVGLPTTARQKSRRRERERGLQNVGNIVYISGSQSGRYRPLGCGGITEVGANKYERWKGALLLSQGGASRQVVHLFL
jgi:hypothetical protein